MIEENLLTTPLGSVLRDLAAQSATGCLIVRDGDGDEAELFLRDGAVYAVAVPGRRTTLGARLVSSGALSPDALADALEIQRIELQGWRLGELLVHLGYVDREVVEAFVVEQLKDSITDLLDRPLGGWKFRKGRKTRQDVAPPTSIDDLLDEIGTRRDAWARIVEKTGGADGVPTLSTAPPTADDVILDANDWALLCKVDGERTIAQLAGECGFTEFEAGSVIVHLMDAGLVEVPLDDDADDDDAGDLAGTTGAAEATGNQREAERRPAAGPHVPTQQGPDRDAPGADGEPDGSTDGEPEASTDGEPKATADGEPEASTDGEPEASTDARPGDDMDAAADAPDAAGLAASIARVAAGMRGDGPAPGAGAGGPADATDQDQRLLDAVAERVARDEAEARRVRQLADEDRRRQEAEMIAAMLEEQAAKDAAARAARSEARRLERSERERLAREEAEREARAAAERHAREEAEREARKAAEWERVAREEADRQAREAAERERLAREEAERARVEAERQAREAAEQAAREEAERQAREAAEHAAREEAERARMEAERHAREAAERAAREEAERQARREAARLAAEEAERIARAEAGRIAQEEAERATREAAERELAAEAERRAREQAAREEAERAAAEQAAQAAAEEAARAAAAQRERIAREEAERIAALELLERSERDDFERQRHSELREARMEEERRAWLAQEQQQHEAAAAAAAEAVAAEEPPPWASEDDNAAALLRELNSEAPEAEPEQRAFTLDEPEPVVASAPVLDRDIADTAALLRELSSLGFGDEPAATPTPPSPPPSRSSPSQSQQDKKKRKGLFGRG